MNEKAVYTLEFTKILKMLSGKAISPMGKSKCDDLMPCADMSTIKMWQGETSEAVSMILKKGSLPLGGIKNIAVAVKRAAMGGVLTTEELMAVSDFLYVSKKMKKYSDEDRKNDCYEQLDELFSQIEVIDRLEKEINRCIISAVEVADDASNGLYDVRRNIKVSYERVKEQLNGVIHSQTYKNMLQDFVVTMRNDRYCVPVKSEYRNVFPGMVHDQSATGATLFMEPMSVVKLNNAIKELMAQERVEINKVLAKLSALVAEHEAALLVNSEIFTHIDFVFAKGELSIEMNATEPVLNDKSIINIKKGRHPLLDPCSVVPTDIYLGETFKTLLITGPNTGGKTVALKTLGLFTLMAQAGLHIAAFDRSDIAVFDDVYADIGDEQSIEQSLSTFSSHMTNIVRILKEAGPNCLVLLDELGAGTDPTEGAALAIAILQTLHKRQALTAVTTHYSELKVYALSTDGVENASCEFNVATLRPTYKLLIGIPGKSNAFAISQKLGLSDEVIASAKEIISHEDARFEDVITDLEISKKTVLAEQGRAEQYRHEAEKLKSEMETQKQKLALQRDKVMFEAKNEARIIMQQAKEDADALIKQMQKQLKESSHKDAQATRQVIREQLSKHEARVNNANTQSRVLRPTPKNLRKGDKVFIHTLNQNGIITKPPDQNGEAVISAGIMKVKVHVSHLSLDESEETVKVNTRSVSHVVKANKSRQVLAEIDLRGLMSAEAIEKTDKYIDDAYLSSLAQVSVIHGKGTGALRAAIQNHLRTHPQVKSFRLGVFGEGDAGVTVVELKK